MKQTYSILLACLVYLVISNEVKAQHFEYTNEPLLSVIHDIEDQTPFHFLYREALIADIKISLSATKERIFDTLQKELSNQNIGLRLDEHRNQALLFTSSKKETTSSLSISGYVLDSETGERLPYSTLAWLENGQLTGIATSDNGTFSTKINSSQQPISILFSYTGYEAKTIDFDLNEQHSWNNLAIRLNPVPYAGQEIVVRGFNAYTAADTVLNGLVKIGTFSPLGDQNSIRSLQALPSVQSGSSITGNLNVRGSPPDGFRVLLDGQTLYNQNHLFGLIDALNSDVLRTSGFYYDITPASFKAPHGGILALITKTGNLQEFSTSLGLSNTTGSISVEGPIKKGNSSFLVSGRHSYIDQANWLNNSDIIEYGLDLDRPYDFQDQDIIPLIQVSRVPKNTSASFYDINTKLYVEQKNGGQFILSGYFGADEASQTYERFFSRFISADYSTTNDWSSNILSASYNNQITSQTSSSSSLGWSDYSANYLKEDYRFQNLQVETGNGQRNVSVSTQSLVLDNSLKEFSAKQSFSTSLERTNINYGIDYSDFQVSYKELSLSNESFLSRRTSQLVDVFAQVDLNNLEIAQVQMGSRLHYFSNGQYVKWSPRFKAQFYPEKQISSGFGYSKNYQFLHRLDFYNINSTDFWIITNEDQPPSSSDYFTTNLKIRPSSDWYFQIEGYYKLYKNMRIHTLNTGLISNTFQEEELPWLYSNSGTGKGVEFFGRKRIQRTTISATYVLSSIKIKNPRLNGGESYYANWDRQNQLSFNVETTLSKGFELFAAWNYSTGTPNRAVIESNESDRLAAYSRIDLSLRYTHISESGQKAMLSISAYNLTDRDNPIYADLKVGLNTSTLLRETAFITVYDLGFQPSLKASLSF
tara:strand:+ start:1925 stop:4546 length:2622 start_codon:yes stop_codon:yes gene_type:complete